MSKHHTFTQPHAPFDPWQDSLDALADRFYSLTGQLMTRAEYLAQANAINARFRAVEAQATGMGEGSA